MLASLCVALAAASPPPPFTALALAHMDLPHGCLSRGYALSSGVSPPLDALGADLDAQDNACGLTWPWYSATSTCTHNTTASGCSARTHAPPGSDATARDAHELDSWRQAAQDPIGHSAWAHLSTAGALIRSLLIALASTIIVVAWECMHRKRAVVAACHRSSCCRQGCQGLRGHGAWAARLVGSRCCHQPIAFLQSGFECLPLMRLLLECRRLVPPLARLLDRSTLAHPLRRFLAVADLVRLLPIATGMMLNPIASPPLIIAALPVAAILTAEPGQWATGAMLRRALSKKGRAKKKSEEKRLFFLCLDVATIMKTVRPATTFSVWRGSGWQPPRAAAFAIKCVACVARSACRFFRTAFGSRNGR